MAVVGATGAVGTEMIHILEERKFPVGELVPLASARSEGNDVTFRGQGLSVKVLQHDSFKAVDVASFSAVASVSKEFGPMAVKAGPVVIDNSSAWRMDPKVPLVVPEVNPHAIKTHQGIIANPNCSTMQLLVALKPIYDAVGIERINVATYQAVSGAGRSAVEELARQTSLLLNGRAMDTKDGTKQIAFNAIPHIDEFQDNRYTKEEMKMTEETKKIFNDNKVKVTATCVRIPVVGGHSEAVNIELRKEYKIEDVRKILADAKGVKLQDDFRNNKYPMPIQVNGKNDVFVGRIRRDNTMKRSEEHTSELQSH